MWRITSRHGMMSLKKSLKTVMLNFSLTRLFNIHSRPFVMSKVYYETFDLIV